MLDTVVQAEEVTVSKPTERTPTGQFLPGHSGCGGRPRGSRAQYAQHFTVDFYDDWVAHGRAAIAAVRKKSPVDYLRAAVAILPKDVNVNVSVFESMSDDELSLTIKRLSNDPDIIRTFGEASSVR